MHGGSCQEGSSPHEGEGDEWIVPSNEDGLVVLDGCVVSFMHFHKHGLASPPTGSSMGFFTTMGLSSSTCPNGIQHISAFVMLCEGYMGIEPHFEL
jgi:hypothetical protein